MDHGPLKQLLKDYSLRFTKGRADIMSIFINRHTAVSHADIEAAVDSKYDRVTIYRTLKSFLAKGLIHKVPDDSGTAHYALCNDACNEIAHRHNHIHFKCKICDEITCLNHLDIPLVSLPRGFKMLECNYLVTGVCDKCN